MADFVDALLLGLHKVVVLVERLLLEEAADVAGALQEKVVQVLGLQARASLGQGRCLASRTKGAHIPLCSEAGLHAAAQCWVRLQVVPARLCSCC